LLARFTKVKITEKNMPQLTRREEWEALSSEPLAAEAMLALDAIERAINGLRDGAYSLVLEGAKAYERRTRGASLTREQAESHYIDSLAALLHAHGVIDFLDGQARSVATGQDPIVTHTYALAQTRYLDEISGGE
jgi:hypothetical protein